MRRSLSQRTKIKILPLVVIGIFCLAYNILTQPVSLDDPPHSPILVTYPHE